MNSGKKVILVAMLSCIALGALAAGPGFINYQGMLTDGNGDPLQGAHDLTFEIYRADDQGIFVLAWTEVQIGQVIQDGQFSVLLGSVTPIPPIVLDNDNCYISVAVDQNPAFLPWQRLTSVPWAMRATVADTALYVSGGGGGSDSDWIVADPNMYAGVSGNVGIGTDAPQSKLDVRLGTLRSSRDAGQYLEIRDIDTGGGSVYGMSRELNKKPLFIGALHDGTGSPGGETWMKFEVGSVAAPTEALTIRETGHVGIGGVHNPQYPLQVSGTASMDGFRMPTGAATGYVLTTDASGVGTWQPGGGGVGTDNDWTIVGNNMYSAVSGYVGVGTASPIAPLHVRKPYGSAATEAFRLQTYFNSTMYHTLAFDGGKIDLTSSQIIAALELNPTSNRDVKIAGGGGDVVVAAGGGDVTIGGEGNVAIGGGGTVTMALGAGNVGVGTATPEAKFHVAGTARVSILEISGADLAEKFPVSEVSEPGTVVVINPEKAGSLRPSHGDYDTKVAGVISGAGGLSVGAVLGQCTTDPDAQPVAMSGRVWTLCDATDHAIEPGDLLTTADKRGHAMKALDPNRSHGAVLGKAMTGLERGETGLVLVLINLQ